jgi:glycosyltransferase involved in cell wall biosynthesis
MTADHTTTGLARLTILVPCYNEEASLDACANRLLEIVEKLVAAGKVSDQSSVCFIDDGSADATWAMISGRAERDRRVHGIKLARNHGHQLALLAGLFEATGDAIVTIDADLQDDPAVIEDMVDAWTAGNDIVFGVRRQRDSDSWSKRTFALAYYRLLRLMGVDIVHNHADFRLMSRRALEILKQYSEVNVFLRGLIPTIGLPRTTVAYDRVGRAAGESKYSIRKMLSLAIDGITSFSPLPLRMIAALGILTFLGSLGLSIWVLWIYFVNQDAVPGWSSSVLPMYFLGGIQLLGIGIVGEYVAKAYMETKRRPRFIIDRTV